MAGPNYLGISKVTESLMRDAISTARIRSNIENIFPRTLTENVAAAAALQAASMFPRGLTDNLASAAVLQLEREFSSLNAGFSASIAIAAQRMLDQVNKGVGREMALAAAAASQSARVASFMPDLSGLQEASRAMQRRMDVLGIAALADLQRMSALQTQSYAQFTQKVSAAQISVGIKQSLGGSWHDALGARLVAAIQEVFAGEAAEAPEASLQTIVFATINRVTGALAIPEKDRANFINLMLLLFTILTNQLTSITDKQEAQDAAAAEHWHIDQSFQRIDRVLAVLVAKTVQHRTRLWSQPKSGSKVIGQIEEGSLVIPRARKGKWVMVAIRAEDSPTGTAITAWMLQCGFRKFWPRPFRKFWPL